MYTVTGTASNGCTKQASITIKIDTVKPTVSITNNTSNDTLTCTRTSISVIATGTSTSYAWDNSLTTNASQSLTIPSLYTVTGTGRNGCTKQARINIKIDTLKPTVSITNNTSNDTLTCTRTTISVTASGAVSYLWSNTLGAGASKSLIAIGTYTVTGTGRNGCTKMDSIIIKGSTIINARIISGDTAICSNAGTSQLSVTDPSITGVWSSKNSAIASVNSTSGLVTGASAGITYIYYTVPGVGSCGTVKDSIRVRTTAPPIAGTLSGTRSICSNGSTTLASTVTGGAWSSRNTNIATVVSGTGLVSGVNSGTVYIKYTVNGTGGCANVSDSLLVTVTKAPIAGPINPANGSSATICSNGSNTTFETAGDAGGVWTSNNINTATVVSGTGVVTGINTGTTYIKYKLTGTGGCANVTDSLLVTVTEAPHAGILGGITNICANSTTTLTSTIPGGVWSTDALPTIASVTDFNFGTIASGVDSGTAAIIYTVSGTDGCAGFDSSKTINVRVTLLPTVDNLQPNSFCINSTITITPPNASAIGYWSSDDTAVSKIDSLSGVMTGVVAGGLSIRYNVVGTGGCDNVYGSGDVTVLAAPYPGILGGTNYICSIGSDTINARGIEILSDPTSPTYASSVWTSANTSVATIDPVLVDDSTIIVQGVSAGTSYVSYSVTASNGCSATDSILVTITAPADAGVISGRTTFCSSGTTSLTTTGDGGGKWTSDNIAVATVDSITGVVSGVIPGTAYIKYTVRGTGGCTNVDVDSIEVTLSPIPSAGIISGDAELCSNGTTTLSSTVPNGAWSTSDLAIATITDSTGIVTPISAGSTIVKYTVTGTNGCTNVTVSDSVTITVISTSLANAGPDQLIPRTSIALMAGSVSGIGYQGRWTTSGTGVFTPNDSTLNATYVPSASDITAGSVTLTLTPYGGFCGTGISDNMLLTFINPDTITIVELTGARVGNVNLLNWTSAKEFNNKGFELQRSIDGVNYYPIAFVNSIATGGTSNTPTVYPQYTDDRIVNSVYYYRLRQVKLDNTFRYSNVVELKDINAISLSIETVYPNPTSKIVNVVVVSPLADNVKLLLTDAAGKTLSILKVGVNSGSTIVPIDLSSYAAGIYYVRLICAADADCELSTLTTHKIIKL